MERTTVRTHMNSDIVEYKIRILALEWPEWDILAGTACVLGDLPGNHDRGWLLVGLVLATELQNGYVGKPCASEEDYENFRNHRIDRLDELVGRVRQMFAMHGEDVVYDVMIKVFQLPKPAAPKVALVAALVAEAMCRLHAGEQQGRALSLNLNLGTGKTSMSQVLTIVLGKPAA